jgi:hypothetical protein
VPAEEIPEDMPEPKGKPVCQTGIFDANLQHDLIMGCSAMGTIHMVQETVVHFSLKCQSTVETACYAMEFIAGQTCLDEAIAMCYELQILGAPLEGPVWIFGDNKSMIDSSLEPSGRIAKQHLILLWHCLREKAAMKIVHCMHIDSKKNESDCLTKHLPCPQLISPHGYAPDGSVKPETALVRRICARLVLNCGTQSLWDIFGWFQ